MESELDCSRQVVRGRDDVRDRGWDFARELRSLRDSCARFKGEEVQAVRRSNEEVERCLLRRQLDESAAWQDFLGAFNNSIDLRLETMNAETNRRLELLDSRLIRVEEGMRFVDGEFSVEVQKAMSEAFLRVERSASAAAAALASQPRRGCQLRSREDSLALGDDVEGYDETELREHFAEEDESDDGFLEAGQGVRVNRGGSVASTSASAKEAREDEREDRAKTVSKLEKLGLRLVVAAESAARNAAADVAREVADAAASKLAELRRQLLKEVERQRSALEATALELGTQADAAAAAAKGAEAAAAVAETFSLRLENSRAEIVEVREASAEHHSDLQQHLATAKEVNGAIGSKVYSLQEQLQAETRRLDVLEGDAEAASEAAQKGEDAAGRLAEALASSSEAWAQQRLALQDHIAEKCAASLSSCEQNSADLSALATAIHSRVEAAETAVGQLRTDLAGGLQKRHSECVDLEIRLAELDKSSRSSIQELAEDSRKATQTLEAALRPEAAAQRKSVQALESESARLSKALRELQCQGISHEWSVPRAQQRVEYLAMDSSDAKGIWMDSPEFSLGGQGPLFLRFYPKGVAGGDGLCAVGLYAPHHDRLAALPLQLDLRVADLRKRARAKTEAEGVLWLAHGFGTLELVKEDLCIGVEIPPFAWAGLEKANPSPMGGGVVCSEQIFQPDFKAKSVPGSPHAAGPGAVLSSPSPSRPGWTVFGDQGDRDVSKQQERRRPWSAHAAAHALRSANMPAFATVPAQRSPKPPATSANPFLSVTSAADSDRRSLNPFIDRA